MGIEDAADLAYVVPRTQDTRRKPRRGVGGAGRRSGRGWLHYHEHRRRARGAERGVMDGTATVHRPLYAGRSKTSVT